MTWVLAVPLPMGSPTMPQVRRRQERQGVTEPCKNNTDSIVIKRALLALTVIVKFATSQAYRIEDTGVSLRNKIYAGCFDKQASEAADIH